MTAKNTQEQGRILEGVGENFSGWPEYVPLLKIVSNPLDLLPGHDQPALVHSVHPAAPARRSQVHLLTTTAVHMLLKVSCIKLGHCGISVR